MDEIYKALGWQGGSIHQIRTEIIRLRQIELYAIALMQCLHFDAQTDNFHPKEWQVKALEALNKAINCGENY